MIKMKGQTPRVNRNTLFFLYPSEVERTGFMNTMKRKIAFENIMDDDNLNLTDEQKQAPNKKADAAVTASAVDRLTARISSMNRPAR